jgi:hypothetical protein
MITSCEMLQFLSVFLKFLTVFLKAHACACAAMRLLLLVALLQRGGGGEASGRVVPPSCPSYCGAFSEAAATPAVLHARWSQHMASANALGSELHQVVSFLSAALQRVRCIRSGGSSSSSSLADAASAISNACDALKPQLVRLCIVLSAGPASPSTINSFCSGSLPELSALASNAAAILAGSDEVRSYNRACTLSMRS